MGHAMDGPWHDLGPHPPTPPAPVSVPPRVVVVDLTPLLPGGENGGAKVFTVGLVRELAAAHPQTRFILLTQAASHDELAALDSPNVTRVVAVGAAYSRSVLSFG